MLADKGPSLSVSIDTPIDSNIKILERRHSLYDQALPTLNYFHLTNRPKFGKSLGLKKYLAMCVDLVPSR